MRRWLGVAAVAVALDQASKWLALEYLYARGTVEIMPMLNLRLAYNKGAAFSFLADAGGWQHYVFIGLAVVVSLFLLQWLREVKDREPLLAFGLSLILGGAIGNVIDRVRFQYVVDFIDVYYQQWHWPTFNVADSWITIGVILVIASMFFESRGKSS